jgi:hypothetical protein
MGTIYLAMGKIDSALVYTQKAYEMAIKSGINYWLTSTYLQFGWGRPLKTKAASITVLD